MPQSPDGEPAHNPLSILLVEDSELGVLTLVMELQYADPQCLITIAPTLKAAIFAAKTHPPDVILLDLHLPDAIDGEATLAAIPALSKIAPVTLLTGESRDDVMKRATQAGVKRFWIKGSWHSGKDGRADMVAALRRDMVERRLMKKLSNLGNPAAGAIDAAE